MEVNALLFEHVCNVFDSRGELDVAIPQNYDDYGFAERARDEVIHALSPEACESMDRQEDGLIIFFGTVEVMRVIEHVPDSFMEPGYSETTQEPVIWSLSYRPGDSDPPILHIEVA